MWYSIAEGSIEASAALIPEESREMGASELVHPEVVTMRRDVSKVRGWALFMIEVALQEA